MTRTEIINYLIQKFNYADYLEIGVGRKINYNAVKCLNKLSVDVDPAAEAIITGDSHNFFEQNKRMFDIIFIDGLHHKDHVLLDIIYSLRFLKPGGTIIVHDCKPVTEKMQQVPRNGEIDWTGDVWKAFVQLRARNDLFMCVVDTDCGCGIIRTGKQIPFYITNPTYSGLTQNYKEWLNLISVNEFMSPLFLKVSFAPSLV